MLAVGLPSLRGAMGDEAIQIVDVPEKNDWIPAPGVSPSPQ
jgi:hypothetical protein